MRVAADRARLDDALACDGIPGFEEDLSAGHSFMGAAGYGAMNAGGLVREGVGDHAVLGDGDFVPAIGAVAGGALAPAAAEIHGYIGTVRHDLKLPSALQHGAAAVD